MTDNSSPDKSKRVYRVDKFVVPAEARAEFITKVQNTHDLLRTLPGFVQDFVLEKSAGPGEFNFVTIVEWESAEAIVNARAAVMAMHERIKFNPQEMFEQLGIRADLGNYVRTHA